MDHSTRSELIRTVESQNEQLQRYEKRLRDVIVAYKGLSKEKEALEASVKALSTTNGQENEENMDCETTHSTSDSEVRKLKEQISTLTNALSTLSDEKSKMETVYQTEKRSLKVGFEAKIKLLTEEKSNCEGIAREFQEQVLELKSQLRTQQQEREKEHNDQALMLVEIQKKLTEERMLKEMVEHQLDDYRQKLAEKESSKEISEKYEKKISNMVNELEQVRQRLKASEEKASEPSPFLLQLQKEMAEMKAQHRIQVQDELCRRVSAEERVTEMSHQSEERVSGLEEKLTELSDVVGNYEKLRYQDQQAIHKLRERVSQLDLENTALARAAHGTNTKVIEISDSEDENLGVQALVDRITQLKGLLKLANQRSERPINIDELLQPAPSIEDDSTTHKRCREELSQLKEEFERYKLRAQSVLKNKSSKDTSSKELDSFKQQIVDLKERIKFLLIQHEESEMSHKAIVSDLRKSIARLKQQHEQDLHSAEVEYAKRAADLEQQLHKHRDRTIALLAEKDNELDMLRISSPTSKPPLDHKSMYSFKESTDYDHEKDDDECDEVDSSVSNMVRRMSQTSSFNNDNIMLHFAHEQARKDVELNSLRKVKHNLETAMRELQQTMATKAVEYSETIDNLIEEKRRLERNKSRESANLEYLKNVTYRFMISNDSHCKQQMLNAIATILEFSPKEKDNVQHFLNSWWGYHPSKTPS